MSLASLKRWQWIAISLVAGLLIGYIRLQFAGDLQDRFGESINGQQHFEQMLSGVVEGQPAFQQITVHAQTVPDGKGGVQRIHIVAGTAFNGHPEESRGKSEAKLYPSFFMAPIPYHPKINLSQFKRPGGPDIAKQFQSIPQPTVMDFLDVLSQSRGLSYTHAWWLELGLLHWTIASFVAVGIVWPTIINLMVYGSWRRPAEEKGIDLSKVRAHTSAPVPTKPQVSNADRRRLEELESELEEKLAGATTVSVQPAKPDTAAIRPLNSEAEDALPVTADTAHHAEFGAKKDDYYPTEVHAGKKE